MTIKQSAQLSFFCWFALSAFGKPVFSHQKWLWPNRFRAADAPVWVSFDVTWSDRAFLAESGPGDQRINIVTPDGANLAPTSTFKGKTKTTAEVELKQPGIYRIESVDPLAYWTQVKRGEKKVWLRKNKLEAAAETIVRSDLYWSKAVAYVTVGDDAKVLPPVANDPLEIVPQRLPNGITAGAEFALRVFSYGKPASRIRVEAFERDSRGHSASRVTTTDDNGACRIVLRESGRVLLSAKLEREADDDPKADLRSFNVYLTLDVVPASP